MNNICPVCNSYLQYSIDQQFLKCSCGFTKRTKPMVEVISLDLYFTDFITKKDRRKQFPNEFTPEIEANAKTLLLKVNGLLNDLGITKGDVTSGFRPDSLNAKVQHAAKGSYHRLGMAVDLLDNKNQDLAKLIESRPDLLKTYGLWLESPAATRGVNTSWSHLDMGSRSDRPSRVFNP